MAEVEAVDGSLYDDLVLLVDVEPGPQFRIAAIAGAPVTRGTIEPERAVGRLLTEAFIDVSDRTLLHFEAAFTNRIDQRYEIDRPEGSFDVSVSPVFEANGVCRRLVAHIVDRVTSAQHRRHLVNAALVEGMPGSVALLDPDGVIRAVNIAWVRYGLERSDDGVLADAGTSYLEVADRAGATSPSARRAASAIRAVLSGDAEQATTEYPDDDSDSPDWFTMRVAPVEIDGKRWAIVTHEDVTELHEARGWWRAMFTAAPVPTVLLDDDGTISAANAAAGALLGVPDRDLVGESAFTFVHPDDRDVLANRLLEARANTDPAEVRLCRPDGGLILVEGRPQVIRGGRRGSAVVQLIDRTEQRRAELRLSMYRELLELVAAGTPLREVGLAVAASTARMIDGSSAVVVLRGMSPICAPGVDDSWVDQPSWRIAIPAGGAASPGEVVVVGRDVASPEDEETARLLASALRLALQRDETAGALATASLHDPFSGLPNAELFGDRLRAALDAMPESATLPAVLTVAIADLDGIVAREGWRAGEARLADAAAHVRAAVPSDATVARRGNRVMVLAAVRDTSEATALADRISVRTDLAVGVSLATGPGTRIDELLGTAEEAIARGSDASVAADDLRRGLDAGEIGVHYQPIIDLRSGRTTGLEALVRWEHPDRGPVPPPELIHVAESCGLISEVGALVLSTACRDLARWRADRGELHMAVNLSARQLSDPGLVDLVREATADSGIDPGALLLEITESVVVDDVDQAVAALAELRDLGVRVAIDDFGTGYSSLIYLKRFPADVLKVDRSFVQGLGVHEGDTAIVDAIVGLGHRLGLEVVAEGVETETQLAELRRRRCDEAQGYLLQRPARAADIDVFLDAGALELGPEPSGAGGSEQLDIDELLSIVTHELSTPLTVIGGHAELLADLVRSGDGDQPSEVVDALERNIRNLDELLHSLSGLSSALRAAGPATTLDVDSFVRQTVTDLAPLLAQHDVTLDVASGASIVVEPVAVRQVLTNLLSNAVKFTEPGTRIDVHARADSEEVTVVVADHGPGVPVEREAELFGRFARLGATVQGLGVGLHLSRALARRLGGDLVHQRTDGGGATFCLRLRR